MTDNGLAEAVKAWSLAAPTPTADLASDKASHGRFWRQADELLTRLPAKPRRTAAESALAAGILAQARNARTGFLRVHAGAVYDALTAQRSRFVRVDELCAEAARAFPGLVPGAEALRREAGLELGAKEGLEADQGILLSQVLADPVAGTHLCHAMLLPREESRAHLAELDAEAKSRSAARICGARARRRSSRMRNPDSSTPRTKRTLAGRRSAWTSRCSTPGPRSRAARRRRGCTRSTAGQRLFGAGINLTHLYQGRIRFLWYLMRDLGYVNKLYRGLARPDVPPEEDSIEKLWIAAVDGFAIGGHCQILLTMD